MCPDTRYACYSKKSAKSRFYNKKRERKTFDSQERETAHDVRGTSVLRRPKRSGDIEPSRHGCASITQKRHPIGCLFVLSESARRGSNPRPSPWQGDAPPLSHSRISMSCHYTVSQRQDIIYIILFYLSTVSLYFILYTLASESLIRASLMVPSSIAAKTPS